MAFTEKLIEAVKAHSILYNIFHPEYKNQRSKDKVWEGIGQQLDTDVKVLKKKWKNIRDNYIKHLRWCECSRGEQESKGIERYKGWPWAPHMAVFRPFLSSSGGGKGGGGGGHSLESNADSDEAVAYPIRVEYKDDDEEEEEEELEEECVSWKQFGARKRKKLRPSERVSKRCEDNGVVMDFDDVDLLFLSHAKTIKKFSVQRQAVLKFQIAKMLMEEELAHYGESCDSSSNLVTSPTAADSSVQRLHSE